MDEDRVMRRGVVAATTAFVAALVAVPFLPTGAHAQSGVFRAVAEADGTRTTYSLPGYLLVNTLVDLGAPTAQAVVDGFGTSRAFASYPYPGENVIAVPGLVKGGGGPSQIPEYPLFVQTSYPSATSASNGSGPYTLKAASQELESSALANASGASGDNKAGFTESTAHALRQDSGAEEAQGETTAESLEFGPAFRIGRV